MHAEDPARRGLTGPVPRRDFLAGALATAVGSAVLPGAARAASGAAKFPFPAGREFTALITGDAGTGKPEQYAVAAAARRTAAEHGVSLAVGLGDNLYLDGPESADDDEFQTKFEQPNAGIDVPWLMILGNHDTSGAVPGSGAGPERGDYEVAYHDASARWYMPARYYSVAVPEANPVVEFFALDTNPVASFLPQRDPHYAWDGPYMREQRAWLDDRLGASRARWKIVIAHHPYLNNGPYGNAGEYNGITVDDYASGKHLKELYEQIVVGRADLIMSGHDHCSQILAPSGGTQQIVCGASAQTEDGQSKVTNESFWQDFSHRGFMTLRVSDAGLTLRAYLVDSADPATATGRLAYTHEIPA
ncbi:metallophosphoesterase [Saccharopolyspora griseoalba]|uniref:Metallophosphoesterase n=1 Tax=Saccharopolyspora griseoalba TaxID=1431848 RepID=A0ABW2LE37_9PSEU